MLHAIYFFIFFFNLDNFVLKNVDFFFFGNQISKWRSFEKGLFWTYFSDFLATKETTQKFLQHISHLHTYTYFAHPINVFAFPILQKKCEFIMYGSLCCDSSC